MIKWKVLGNVFSVVPGNLGSIAVRMTYISYWYLRTMFSYFQSRLNYRIKNGLPQTSVVLIKHQGNISIHIHANDSWNTYINNIISNQNYS